MHSSKTLESVMVIFAGAEFIFFLLIGPKHFDTQSEVFTSQSLCYFTFNVKNLQCECKSIKCVKSVSLPKCQ